VSKKAPAAKKPAAKPVAAKKAAPAPKKATVKKAAPKVAVKPAKPAATKVVVKKATVSKSAPTRKAVVTKTTAAPPAKQIVKKTTAPVVKPVAKKVPAEKQKAVTKSVPAERESEVVKSSILKQEEKEVIMPVKKSDKEKETGKKVAAEKTEKVERVEKAATPAKSERPERTEKKGSKSATTLVSYQPEFTKSVLDQPDAPTGPIYRYSDSDLQEFRDLITKKLEAAKKELVYLQGLITRKDEAGTDDTENKYMSMEDGSGSQEREQLNQMASLQIQFIDHLEKAMVRIENKTYGICRVTGKLIDKARLRAVPHATLSIEAKLAKSK
jgi:RNA polymerase-binding transcription factor DksA